MPGSSRLLVISRACVRERERERERERKGERGKARARLQYHMLGTELFVHRGCMHAGEREVRVCVCVCVCSRERGDGEFNYHYSDSLLHTSLYRWWCGARGAEDADAGGGVNADDVADGDLEARRRRLHRDRGGSVVAPERLVVAPTARPALIPLD